MIDNNNQSELLTYIKARLEEGANKEDIRNNLKIEGGWTQEDIDAAFAGFKNNVGVQTQAQQTPPTSTPSSYIKLIIGIVVAVLVIAGGVGAYFFINQRGDVESNLGSTDQTIDSIQLSLDIVIAKDTYKVGEKFTGGEYLLSYNGKTFEGVVVYKKSRKGFEKTAYSKATGNIKAGDFNSNPFLREGMLAFKMDETGFEVGKDSFEEAGEYVFTISVYKCSDVVLRNMDCSDISSRELVSSTQPLASAAKIIIVTNEEVQTSSKPKEESDGETVLDCNVDEDPLCQTGFFDLFTERLQSCKVSKGTTPIGWEPIIGLFRGYEILGVQNNLCSIDFWFLETEDVPANLLDKQINCKYATSERTVEKVAKVENCTGPLLKEINALTSEW